MYRVGYLLAPKVLSSKGMDIVRSELVSSYWTAFRISLVSQAEGSHRSCLAAPSLLYTQTSTDGSTEQYSRHCYHFSVLLSLLI